MKNNVKLSIFVAAVLFAAVIVPSAHADGRGRSMGKVTRNAPRPDRGGAPSVRAPRLPSAPNLGGRGGSPFPLLDALGRAANDRGGRNNGQNSPFPLLEALSRAANDKDRKNHSSDPLDFLYGLSQLGGYGVPGGGYGGYPGSGAYPYYDSYYRHKSDEEYADAIRDAAIAGAVGNVVSAIVSSQSVRTPVPTYAQPAPTYAQPAPPPAYVQPSPTGYYETRREVVGGGYYERSQVWVPDQRDPRTGHIIEGHYETVRRWVPEVIQETRVWVAP